LSNEEKNIMYSNRRSISSGLSGVVVLLGLILAFTFSGFNLTIFFIALAFAALVGSLGTPNPRAVYGGIVSAMWLLILALFFATYNWIWFLVGALISALLGALIKPIIAALLGIGILGLTSTQQPQQPSQPQQSYQPYQPVSETYQEGGQQYQYPSTPPVDQEQQPQAIYPEQMPPQQ
jgi:hypothetical protein